MGRLTLNVLLSFAQFEREVTGERIRDKVAALKKKGIWMGGHVPLGYDLANRELIVNQKEAEMVRKIFLEYLEQRCVTKLYEELKSSAIRSKQWVSSTGRQFGGAVLSRGSLYHLLNNPIYIGKTKHKGVLHNGQHKPILELEMWDQVVALLKENSVIRHRSRNIRSGRILHGKLVTGDGHSYTPTHASKKGRRYFYYTLTRPAAHASANAIKRMRADEVEARVFSCVSAYLEDSLRVAATFPTLNIREVRLLTSAAKHRAALLSDSSSKDGRDFLQQVLTRVGVNSDELQIDLNGSTLRKELLGTAGPTDEKSSASIELREPLLIARRGSEVRLILSSSEQQLNEPIPSLVRAVVQARSWSEWIVAGEVSTLNELAKKAGLTRQYTSRILRLAALSPQLVDAILKCQHSPILTVASITSHLPLEWELQHILG